MLAAAATLVVAVKDRTKWVVAEVVDVGFVEDAERVVAAVEAAVLAEDVEVVGHAWEVAAVEAFR